MCQCDTIKILLWGKKMSLHTDQKCKKLIENISDIPQLIERVKGDSPVYNKRVAI